MGAHGENFVEVGRELRYFKLDSLKYFGKRETKLLIVRTMIHVEDNLFIYLFFLDNILLCSPG